MTTDCKNLHVRQVTGKARISSVSGNPHCRGDVVVRVLLFQLDLGTRTMSLTAFLTAPHWHLLNTYTRRLQC